MLIKVTYSDNCSNNLNYLYQIFIRIIEEDQAHQNFSISEGENNEENNSIYSCKYEQSRFD